jgi:tetratricopeptide (TPR) repeat protein
VGYSQTQGIHNLLGEAYQGLNETDKAESWYRKSLEERPDQVPAYLKYGKMLARNVSSSADMGGQLSFKVSGSIPKLLQWRGLPSPFDPGCAISKLHYYFSPTCCLAI